MRKANITGLAAAALIALFATGAWAAPVEIQWWHSMTGANGERVNKIAEKYNASQDKYKVTPSFKGNYDVSLTQAIAAYRAGKAPEIVQVFEVGTQTMMLSGAVYPVQDLMKEQGYTINWDAFVQPVLSYYRTTDGKLMSMPFNSSSPIMYYNMDHLAKAGITKVPVTWDDMDAALTKLDAAGQKCGFSPGWQGWTQIENYSALNGVPYATEANGFKGLNAKLAFNNPQVLKHISLLARWAKEGKMSYEGRTGAGAEAAFISQKCSIMTSSSAAYGLVAGPAKFKWTAGPLPLEKGAPVRNSIIGGATLWVMKGHSADENAATASFMNFLAEADNQIWWHEETGYLPITLAAYEKAKAQGYYAKVPTQEIAILQLTRAKTTDVSRGLRLGNFTQIRVVVDEELENVWGGKKTPEQGLNDAVRRGDELLRQFEQANK